MKPANCIQTPDASLDAHDARTDFLDSLREGFARQQKAIPSRFLYDARGSQLFEEITRLPEYYPTRTERSILEKYGSQMARATPAGSALIEFGSGSSRKTEILLSNLDKLAAYVPIDISSDALAEASTRLQRLFPSLPVMPVVADFMKPVVLPSKVKDYPKLGFFPGSTIGNFLPLHAVGLLSNMSRTLGPQSRLIIGVDLRKDKKTLLAAYNDAAGITAQFNLNLLKHANRELGADFDTSAFRHEATYDEDYGRIDMYLVSGKSQDVRIKGQRFHFNNGERIHTEYSHKYDLDQFSDLARQANWNTRTIWSDDDKLFAVVELINS